MSLLRALGCDEIQGYLISKVFIQINGVSAKKNISAIFSRTCIQHETRDEHHGEWGIDEGGGYIRPVALLHVKAAQ